eukprot:257690_1
MRYQPRTTTIVAIPSVSITNHVATGSHRDMYAFNSTNLPVVNDKQIVAIRREDRWQYGGKFDGNTCRKFDNNNCRKFDGNNYMNFDDNCHNKRRNYHPNLWRNKGSKMTRIIA